MAFVILVAKMLGDFLPVLLKMLSEGLDMILKLKIVRRIKELLSSEAQERPGMGNMVFNYNSIFYSVRYPKVKGKK